MRKASALFQPAVPVQITVETHDGKPLPCRLHGIHVLPPNRIAHLVCWSTACFVAVWQEGRKLLRYGPIVPSRLIGPDYDKILRCEPLPSRESLGSNKNSIVNVRLNPEIFTALVAMARRAGVTPATMAKLIVTERVESELLIHARRLKHRRLEVQRAEREKVVETRSSE